MKLSNDPDVPFPQMLSLGRAAVGVLRIEARTAKMANSRLHLKDMIQKRSKIKRAQREGKQHRGRSGGRESKRRKRENKGEGREGERERGINEGKRKKKRALREIHSGPALTCQNSANWWQQLRGWWSSQEQVSAPSLECPLSGVLGGSGGHIRWNHRETVKSRFVKAQDLATPGAFYRDPSLVWEFYHYRREVRC